MRVLGFIDIIYEIWNVEKDILSFASKTWKIKHSISSVSPMSSYFYSYSLPSAAWSMDEKQILDEADEMIHSYTGKTFIDDVSRYLSNTLKMDYVLIGKVTGRGNSKLQSEAFYHSGHKLPNIDYELQGTASEKVIGTGLCYYPQGIQSIFPKDKVLRELYIESYIGQPLHDASGRRIGIIVLMHREIIPQAGFVEALLTAISLKVESELRFPVFQ